MCRDIIRVFYGIAIAVVSLLTLMSCAVLKEQAGLTKKVPDEFTVIAKAPLVKPPEFSLRPPRPGAKRPQVLQPSEQARKTLLGGGSDGRARAEHAHNTGRNTLAGVIGTKNMGKVGKAEQALLEKAGATSADSSIRQIVNRETSVLAEKDSSFADRLIFWQEKLPSGTAVDARKEARRLREAAAAGKTPNEGKTPVIKRRKRGLLESIF